MVLKSDRDAGHKPVPALDDLPARIHQQEASRTVGVFHTARFEAALAEQGTLLIPGSTGNRDLSAVQLKLRLSVDGTGRSDLRQNIRRDVHQLQEFFVPLQLMDIKEHRAAGIGEVGGMHGPVRQVPHQPAVDGAEQQVARLRAPSGSGDMIQQPLDLRSGKIGVGYEACLFPDGLTVARSHQLIDGLGGTAALPYDRIGDRLSCFLIPDHGCLALVGDADGSNVLGRSIELIQCSAGDLQGHIPDFICVMLNPAGLRVDLPELLLYRAADIAVMIEEDTAGTGRPLVERHDVFHADRLVRSPAGMS